MQNIQKDLFSSSWFAVLALISRATTIYNIKFLTTFNKSFSASQKGKQKEFFSVLTRIGLRPLSKVKETQIEPKTEEIIET
jgi:hypothetical protein